jgi:hypothetical protein
MRCPLIGIFPQKWRCGHVPRFATVGQNQPPHRSFEAKKNLPSVILLTVSDRLNSQRPFLCVVSTRENLAILTTIE